MNSLSSKEYEVAAAVCKAIKVNGQRCTMKARDGYCGNHIVKAVAAGLVTHVHDGKPGGCWCGTPLVEHAPSSLLKALEAIAHMHTNADTDHAQLSALCIATARIAINCPTCHGRGGKSDGYDTYEWLRCSPCDGTGKSRAAIEAERNA